METPESQNGKTSFSFGERDGDLERLAITRIERAELLGWTDVRFVYDDEYGGLYLGGVDQNGEWGHVPNINNLNVNYQNDPNK